jgi:hypothetical protein
VLEVLGCAQILKKKPTTKDDEYEHDSREMWL